MYKLAILYSNSGYFITHSPKVVEKRVDDFPGLKRVLREYERNQPDVFKEEPQLVDLVADEEKYIMGLRASILKRELVKA